MPSVRENLEVAVQTALAPLLVSGLGGGATGYLRRVAPYVGDIVADAKIEDLRESLSGRTPAVFFLTDQGTYRLIDLEQRKADRQLDVRFYIVSGSLRTKESRTQGGLGTDVDPGIYQMLEDLRFKLYGKELGVDGVGFLSQKSERMHVFAPDLTIWEAIYNVDTDVFLAADGEINPNETEPPAAQTEYTVIGGKVNIPELDGVVELDTDVT